MTRSDDEILEFLLNEPAGRIRATPNVIEANISVSYTTVNRRLAKLLDAGMVRKVDPGEYEGLYEITELGERYLSGDADKADLEL